MTYQALDMDLARRLRVALMDGNEDFSETIVRWLQDAGHSSHREASGAKFMQLLSRETFDVVVLGTNASERSGEEVLRWMRATLGLATPTLLLVEPKERASVGWLLHCGADDCSIKPIERHEFLMRLKALTRRSQAAQNPYVLQVGNLRLHHREQRIFVEDREAFLTPKEFRLISYVLANVGRTLSRGAIFEAVWGTPVRPDMRTLNTHMSQIRSKLHLTPDFGWRLTSAYGHGYRLEYFGDASPVPPTNPFGAERAADATASLQDMAGAAAADPIEPSIVRELEKAQI